MADEALEKLEEKLDTCRSLASAKLLTEAKAVQVVWARVKGYPAWPAQILSEAAAMRRPDLGQAAHSKDQKLPVMFFGTVEVAWVKDSDIVDFKDGLLQGYYDKKTKPFKLALEQVCEFLALNRKRKAPPKWWCKPPSNGLEEHSEGSGSKLGATTGGAAKGPAQRQDAGKASRQRVSSPVASESDSSSSEEDEPPAPRGVGKKGPAKSEGGKDSGAAAASIKPKPPIVPPVKPRDSSAPRPARENGSTTASSSAAAQPQAKRPASAPPGRPQPSASVDTKDGRAAAVAPSGAKAAAAPPPKQPERPKTVGGAASSKEKDAELPPRKRLKVESSNPASAARPSVAVPQPPLERPAARAPALGAVAVAELAAAGSGEVDILKLPAEIRRLAGIRLPAVPKKPGAKVEESPREQAGPPAVKAAAATAAPGTTAKGPAGSSKRRSVGVDTRGKVGPSGDKGSEQAGKAEGAAGSRGKRSRRSRSPTVSDEEEEDASAASSDSDDEGSQSGDEADSEEEEESNSDSSSEEAEESADEDDDKAVVAVHKGSRTAGAGNRVSQPQAKARTQVPAQPKRDRRGEKQRRLARLAMPEPADRRTSSRLVPKASDKAPQTSVPKAASVSRGGDKSDEGDTRSSTSGSDSEEQASGRNRRPQPAAGKGLSDTEGGGRRLRSGKLSPEVPRAKSEPLDAAPVVRKSLPGLPPPGPSRPQSQPPEAVRKSEGGASGSDSQSHKKQSTRNGRVEVSGGASGAVALKAVPLELRRLQNDSSSGPPVVDTAEPRTLRDRSSPAMRAAASAATPSQTGATTALGSKRAEKRCSDDGSGASISLRDVVAEGGRAQQPEQGQEGLKASPPEREQGQDGHGKPESATVSASPPPAPVAAGVPVRSKPTSLGQAAGRQPPALLPARAAVCNLASKADVPPAPALAGSAGAGTSAAGALAPAPVCVARKPSTGPPTRHVVERGALAHVSSTDLPDAAPADGAAAEGGGNDKLGPSVDAARATHAPACTVPPVGQEEVAMAVEDSAAVGQPESAPEPESELRPPPAQLAQQEAQSHKEAKTGTDDVMMTEREAVRAPIELHPPSLRTDAPQQQHVKSEAQEQPPEVQQPVAPEHPQDAPQLEQRDPPPQQQPQELQPPQEPQAPQESQQLQEPQQPTQLPSQELQPQEAQASLEGAVAMDIDTQSPPEPGPSLRKEPQGLQLLTGDASTLDSAHVPLPELRPPLSDAQPQPASTSEPPAAPAQESCQPSRSPTHPMRSPEQRTAAGAEEPEVQRRPCSMRASPMREENLLAEEQLPPDQPEEQEAQQGAHGPGPASCAAAASVFAAQAAAVEPAVCERLTSDESLSDDVDHRPARPMPSARVAHARNSGAGDESSAGGGSDGALGGTADASCTGAFPAGVLDDKEAAHAREMEELGEVAAALAGLQQAEPPRLPPMRSAQAEAMSFSGMGHEDYLDRIRNRAQRGLSGRGGSREVTAAPMQQAQPSLQAFSWPQPEPLLPSQDQPFSLPREWLLTRPPRYEPVRRNVYLSRVKPKRLPKDEISICACRPPHPADPRPGCGQNCLNRLSSILCDPKLCPCGELCSNRSLHLLRPPKTEVFLTENRGWGVRAVEPVTKGGFIIEYAGEVIDERELGRRMDHARMNGEPHFYIMELSAGLYIDARRKGNTARLINSSCDPNCETQKWHDASTGEVRVGIFAIRDIAPGEELVYDYFFSTYGAMKQCASSFVCMCGAKNCRGTMDLHPEKRRDLGRRVEVYWDADGQYYRAVVVAYHPTSRKHTVMYEDGGTEKLCLDEVPHRWMDESPAKRNSLRGDATFHPAAHPAQQTAQPERLAAGRGDAEAQLSDSSRNAAAAPVPAVVTQPPPRVAEAPCSLPPLGSSASAGALSAHAHGSLGKHGLQEGDLHLPLKKRQKMMQQAPLPSAGLHGAGEAHGGGSSLPQGSANGGDAPPGARLCGAADGGRELSGDTSAAAAMDEETAEDLSSLLEAAEAVAALRTAPVGPPQDSTLPLQPRHIRSGNAMPSSGTTGGAVAMVQTAKVASPRHLAVVQRSGPPNGLPPHGGSSAFGRPSAHPSSSSGSLAGHRQHRPGQQSHETSPVGHHEPLQREQSYGKNGRAAAMSANGSNGYGSNGINREDLLWRLVGIEKPNDLLPLFACEKKDSWSSHPYGKLLRALEASELLPHAEQLRQQYQQVQQAPQQQAIQPQPAAAAAAAPPPQQHAPTAAGAAAAATATALAAWHAQHAAAAQAAAQAQAAAAAASQYPGAHAGAAFTAGPANMAALIQAQQQHAAAAAAAASAGQLPQQQHPVAAAAQPAHHHATAAAAGAAGGAMPAAQLAAHQPHQLAAVAAQWQHMAHAAHQGQIWQDLVGMYVAHHHAQHAAPHQMLAMAGAAAATGVPAAPVR